MVYKRVIVKDNKLVGAVLYGDTADGNWYFDLLKKGEDIADIREALIFGQAFAMGAPLRTRMPPLPPFRMMPKSAAATAFQGRWSPPSRRAPLARRGAQPVQGQRFLRLLHRAGGKPAGADAGR
jgi:hypothetical protein